MQKVFSYSFWPDAGRARAPDVVDRRENSSRSIKVCNGPKNGRKAEIGLIFFSVESNRERNSPMAASKAGTRLCVCLLVLLLLFSPLVLS